MVVRGAARSHHDPLDITRTAKGNTFRSKTRITLTVTAIVIVIGASAVHSGIGRASRPSLTGSSYLTPQPGGRSRRNTYLLVGSLAHSGVWRAVISPSLDLPHLLAAMTVLLGLLGGV